MTSKSKNVYIHNLDDIVDQYNDRHQQNQNEPCWCKVYNKCIEFDRNNDTKDPKFNVGDHVRTSEYLRHTELVWRILCDNILFKKYCLKKCC